jgi:hypothetical protein
MSSLLDEPVRRSVPDPSLFSLSGLEQIRAYTRGLMPSTPSARLLGYRVTQVRSGTAVLAQPISDRGVHALKGLDGTWQLYGVEG